MKIVIEEPQDNEDEQVIFKCHQMTPDILRVIAMLKAQDALIVYDGKEAHRIHLIDVYYIESVDNKTFFYYKNKVYESKQKLYELEDTLINSDFLRISKSMILNLSKIKTLRPALSGRLEAELENGEKIIISRQYVGDLKKKLY